GSTVTLYTRGFQFWDGQEPSVNVQVSFSGGQVSSLRPAQGSQDIYLARLEPVEIAQINPETGEDRLPIAYEDVPQALLDAVVAVEDQRFYSHFGVDPRSEEHTSELQSRENLVCRLLLEKNK